MIFLRRAAVRGLASGAELGLGLRANSFPLTARWSLQEVGRGELDLLRNLCRGEAWRLVWQSQVR